MFYGCNLKKIRMDSGMSLKRLAGDLGIHTNTLLRLEKGEYNPKINTLAKIAKHFGMSVDDLFLKDWRDKIAS